MQKGHTLHFKCIRCENPVEFSIFRLNESQNTLECTSCKKSYSFSDEVLLRQLTKFEKLCTLIAECEEILSDVSVGIDLDGKSVKIPYKILLTRLNSTLSLNIEEMPISIDFRLEPIADLPPVTQKKIPIKFSPDA